MAGMFIPVAQIIRAVVGIVWVLAGIVCAVAGIVCAVELKMELNTHYSEVNSKIN